MPITKECLVCGKPFITSEARIKKGNGKFCSRKCLGFSKRNRVERVCKTCSKEFEVKLSMIKKGYGKFCCNKCYFKSDEVKLGGKASKERRCTWRDKISASKKGVPRTPSDKYGMSEEAKLRLSKERSGENSHFWKDGRTNLTTRLYHGYHYKKWRKEIFDRDDYTCQVCEVRGGYLEADHIKPRSIIVDRFLSDRPELKEIDKQYEALLECKELWNTSNGRTLCKTCHIATDSYGNKIYTKLHGNQNNGFSNPYR